MFRKLSACPAGGCVLALPSAVGWVAEHECGSAVSMPSTPRPSAVDADMRRQHLNAEPLWPSLITHDPQPLGLDTTLAPLQAGADVATLSATPRREMASASKAAPRHTRHDSLCAEWSCQQSRASADAAALGSSSTPLTGTQKVSAWLHAFPLLPLQIQGLGSGQGCQRTAIPRQHKTERDAAVERNCVVRQERRALGAALACTAASAEFRARCAQKGLCLGGTSAPL